MTPLLIDIERFSCPQLQLLLWSDLNYFYKHFIPCSCWYFISSAAHHISPPCSGCLHTFSSPLHSSSLGPSDDLHHRIPADQCIISIFRTKCVSETKLISSVACSSMYNVLATTSSRDCEGVVHQALRQARPARTVYRRNLKADLTFYKRLKVWRQIYITFNG